MPILRGGTTNNLVRNTSAYSGQTHNDPFSSIKFAEAGYLIPADESSYTLTGTDATVNHSWVIPAYNTIDGLDAFSATIDGLTAWPTDNYDGGFYVQSGSAAILARGKFLAAAAGSYSLTGSLAGVIKGWKLPAAAGSYSLTGSAAGTLHGWRVAAAAGSYSLTGAIANLKHAWKLPAAAGAYALTGSVAGVLHGWKVGAGVGSYALTGSTAGLKHGWAVTATSGSYTFTGSAAGLKHGWVATAAAGSYALTGSAATLTKSTAAGKTITADAGSYALAGTDATLLKSTAQEERITGGAGHWPEHKPQYRVHPEYDEQPKKKKKRVTQVGEQVILAGEPEIQTGIITVKPAWDALVELQQRQAEAEQARKDKLRAIALADDEWLMVA